MYWHKIIPSPVGELILMAKQHKLVAVTWVEHPCRHQGLDQSRHDQSHPVLQETALQLDEYFSGERHQFCLPLVTMGTPFQTMVWQALEEIPYGETCSYADIADLIGKPAACRAVGAASGANPLAIVVPCHRVIARRGQLQGFLGGIESKQWLLHREQHHSIYLN